MRKTFFLFLLCLAPTLLAYALIFAVAKDLDNVLGVMLTLIVIGALLSGIVVAMVVMRSMAPQRQATVPKVILAILVFFGVGLGYFSVAIAGCCGLAISAG